MQYDDQILQLFTSSLFLAGAFAALVAMVLSKKYGRRFVMIMGGAAFIIGECSPSSLLRVHHCSSAMHAQMAGPCPRPSMPR